MQPSGQSKWTWKLLSGIFGACACALWSPLCPAQQTTFPTESQFTLPVGFEAPSASRIDSTSGLPTRVVHSRSGVAFLLVPAGQFKMGSPESEPSRSKSEVQHSRTISQPFYLAETEITFAQFSKFIAETGYLTDAERGTFEGGHTLGGFAALPEGEREWNVQTSWRNPFPHLPDMKSKDDFPIIHVSWNDAKKYCQHFGLRLPSEAEWEYACRAGTTTTYFWGDTEKNGAAFANVSDSSAAKAFPKVNIPFSFDDGMPMLASVRTYRPNPWGFYDLIGNVEEWCEDSWGKFPPAKPDESAFVGEESSGKIIRGGAWTSNREEGRSANRSAMSAASRRDFIGFRPAVSPIVK